MSSARMLAMPFRLKPVGPMRTLTPDGAATRSFAIGGGLGALGLLACVVAASEAVARTAVSPGAAGHQVTILGQSLTYPSAGPSAWMVIALAIAGFIVLLRAVTGGLTEVARQRRLVSALEQRTLWRHPGEARVLDDARVHAFCAGLLRPRIYVSSATVALLAPDELRAILAHEAHHARRRDPLRLATARVLSRALFLVPAVGKLCADYEQLCEMGADQAAVRAAQGDCSELAAAMLAMDEARTPGSGGIDSARIDHLLGRPLAWRLPFAACGLAGVAITVFGGLVLVAARSAAVHATFALPFVDRRPCLLALCLVAAGAAWVATRFAGLLRA